MEVYNHYEINNMRQDAIRRAKEMQRKSNMGMQSTAGRPMNSPYNSNSSGMQNKHMNSQSSSQNAGVQNVSRPMNSSYGSNTKNNNSQPEPLRYEIPYPFGYYSRKNSNNSNETNKQQFNNSGKANSNNNFAYGKPFPHKDMQEQIKEEKKPAKEPPASVGNFLNGILGNFLYDSQGKIDSEKLLVLGLIFLLAKEGVDIKLLLALGYILI